MGRLLGAPLPRLFLTTWVLTVLTLGGRAQPNKHRRVRHRRRCTSICRNGGRYELPGMSKERHITRLAQYHPFPITVVSYREYPAISPKSDVFFNLAKDPVYLLTYWIDLKLVLEARIVLDLMIC